MIAGTETPSRPKTTPGPTLRAARLEDYPQIQQLESSHGLLALEERDWRAMWVDNPLRSRLGQNFPIGWVLEDADRRIVGSLANIPTLYTYQGRDLIAVTGRAWVVASDYRFMALMLTYKYFNQGGVDLLIDTTVNSMAVNPFSAFGSVRVPLGDWESAAFRITCYRNFAAAALRIKGAPLPRLLAHPAGLGLRIKDALTLEALPPAPDSYTVEQVDAFDSRLPPRCARDMPGSSPPRATACFAPTASSSGRTTPSPAWSACAWSITRPSTPTPTSCRQCSAPLWRGALPRVFTSSST
jgi:hypothetical protein